jgi:hypothetical protein
MLTLLLRPRRARTRGLQLVVAAAALLMATGAGAKNIVDLDSREVLFTVEHEVRSQPHPLYGRPLVNRNPAQSNRDYKPGHDSISWAMA